MQYTPRLPKGGYGKPVSLGIGYQPCKCSETAQDPACRNRSTYVIDYVGGKPVGHRECPNRFEDRELWHGIYFVLYMVKDWAGVSSTLGMSPLHMAYPHYVFFEAVFAARDRYQQQRLDKE